jgi:hypothetical protein
VAGRIWNLGQDALAVCLLTLIALRLAGVIAWSWWWVLAPLWGSIALYPAGHPGSLTGGKGSSWRLRLPGQLPVAAIPLIALKLARIIGWSWWWVLAPLWGSIAFVVLLTGGFLVLLILQHREDPLIPRRILKLIVEPGHFPGPRRRRGPRYDEH